MLQQVLDPVLSVAVEDGHPAQAPRMLRYTTPSR